VLHTAARHGLPDLATQVLEILKTLKTKIQEFHFAPVIEAFCKANKMKEAFQLLHLMRAYHITPLPSTSFSLFENIRRDVETIDKTYALVKQMKDAGEPVDISVLEVFLQAAIYQGDLQRALEIYESFPEFDAVPTINTLNFLLAGCVAARHRVLGDKLLDEMTNQKSIKPDLHTYEQMILLCLTQDTYEDAFFYLEEMKGAGFFPSLKIYEELVRKCVASDDPRYKIAVSEMRECNYPISPDLKEVLTQANLRGHGTWVGSNNSPKSQFPP
jgi:pentatricopeptide repeat protein